MEERDARRAKRPGVWTGYVVYCIAMALLYLSCVPMGLFFFFWGADLPDTSAAEARLVGVVFGGLGVVLFIPFALGPLLPRRPWTWVYGLVLICLGMTSACCLPVTIPLLIYWIKPEAKAFFGRE